MSEKVVMHPLLERLMLIEARLENLEERQIAIGYVLAWILNEIGKDKSLAFLGRIANEMENHGEENLEFVAEIDEIREFLLKEPAFQESDGEKEYGAST